MPSWNHLPVEIKQHVAKKLDFMSRHSMKSTSHRDRQIVNSTSFHIPRVRFGYKESKCLIVIYTEIEKFLRLELSECKSGIMIHRSENSWDPKDISTKILPTNDTLKLGISILKSLLAHKSIKIRAIEWEITKLGDKNADKKLSKRFRNYFDGAKFRVKEMVYMYWSNMNTIKELCYVDELEYIRNIGIIMSSENLVPVAAHDIYLRVVGGTPHCITKLRLTNSVEQLTVISGVLASQLLSDERNIMASCRVLCGRETDDREFKIIEENGLKEFCHKTKCGNWMHQMRPEYVDQVKRQFDLETKKCGLGPLCKKCADPFEYWYQQNLPRRLIYEPFWDGIILPWKFGNDIERETEILRKKLALDEKDKERNQKGKKIQKTAASWGFRQAPIEDIVFNNKKNQEKKNKKKMKKLFNKGVVVKDSEYVKTPESFEEKEDNSCLEDVVVNDSEKDVNTPESLEVEKEINKHESGDNSENLETLEYNEYLTASENEEEVKEDVKMMAPSSSSKSYQFLKIFISIILGPIFLSIIYYSIISYFNY